MKKNKWISLILAIAMVITSLMPTTAMTAMAAEGNTAIRELMVDNVVNPVGIDNTAPRFSWKMDSAVQGQIQTAYQIEVSELGGNEVWNTGKVESDKAVDIIYEGSALTSSTTYQWHVTAWDKDDNAIVSDHATFEMGLLEEDAFSDVNWIRMPKKGDPDPDAQEPVIDKSVYTIEANLQFKDAVGLVFAAKDNSHFYMWQLNNNMEQGVKGSWLRPHVWNGNGGTFNPENISNYNGYQLEDELSNNTDYNLRLVVNTTTNVVETYINNDLVNSLDCKDADLSYGKIGFRQATNPAAGLREQVWLDDIKVTANDGTILFYQDFSLENDMQFDGGVVENGKLYLAYGENQGDKVFLSKDSSMYYRFDTDFTIKSGKAGIIYGSNAEGTQFYYSQINPNYSSGPAVVQHIRELDGRKYKFDDGAINNIAKEDLVNKKHHFTLTCSNKQEVRIYIDGVEAKYHDKLDKFQFDGKFGFNSDGGDDVVYDNIVVKVAGMPKVFTDGNTVENIFDNGTVENGGLRIAGESTALLKNALSGKPDPEPEPDAPVHYIVESDITVTSDSAGIVFSASDSSNMFMWQINGADHKGKLYLRPHIWDNGKAHYDKYEKDISSFFDYNTEILNKEVHVKIEVTNQEIKTSINDKLVDTFQVTSETPGKIMDGRVGFRSGTATENFMVDNLKVTTFEEGGPAEGTVKLSYDFDDGINPFGGSAGQANSGSFKDGKFVVKGNAGVLLTKDYSNLGMPMFRKTFETEDKEIVSAKVYASSLGVYDLYVNGTRVGRPDENGETIYDEMKPGWTDYNERVLYYSHDITDLMKKGGENVILAQVGTGWWTGRISYNTYGTKDMAFLAKTIITYSDGTQKVLNTDSSWKTSKEGVIREADIWDGETYDANYPSASVMSASEYTEDESWSKVSYDTNFNGVISAQVGQTIQVRKELERTPVTTSVYQGSKDNGSDYGTVNVVKDDYKANDVIELKKGQTVVYDLGQNMVGWPNITVKAPKEAQISMHFAEMLNDSGKISRGNDGPEGSLYMANYRSAASTSIYIAKGDEVESYRPTFSFYGFRYVSISADTDITIDSFKAEVLGSAIPETGSLETSNASVNQLISNTLWGQRSNYLSVPTDCPQRDERLGWSGDTQVFIGAASYNANVAGFFNKWGQDARDSQTSAGQYTDTIPRSAAVGAGNAAWGDAGVIVPYTMYKMYGDTQIISQMYESMEKYMNWLNSRGFEGAGLAYCDWLAPNEQDNQGIIRNLIACAYYAYDTQLMAEMSDAIGETQKAETYRTRLDEIKNHFQEKYINNDGTLVAGADTQTGYLITLKVDLFRDEEQKQAATEILVNKIKANGNKLGTGFVGTAMLNQTLTEAGAVDMAYTLLLQRDNPSWMYSIDQGATTIWERWNSYTKENGFGPVDMNSFNHYSYGAIVEWMYSDMLGIKADEDQPGFKHIVLKPQPDRRADEDIPANQERITWVKGSYDSAYGMIDAEWDWSEDGFNYTAAIPANTSATAYIPVEKDMEVTVNGVLADEFKKEKDGIQYVDTVDGNAVFEITAGTYVFKTAYKEAADKTELKKAIQDAKDVKETDTYKNATINSQSAFDTALTAAEKVLKNGKATAEEITKAIADLSKATEGLTAEEKPADKTELEKAIKEANDMMGTDKYQTASKETKEAFDNALGSAQDIFMKEGATEEEIADAIDVLLGAMEGLQPEDPPVVLPQVLTDEANGVTLTAETETWPRDTQLLVDRVESGSRHDLAAEALKDVTREFTALDIALTSAQGEVSLDGKEVQAAMRIPEYYDADQLALYKVSDDGVKTEQAFTFTDESKTEVTFKTSTLGLLVWVDLRLVPDENGLQVVFEKTNMLWDETTRILEISMKDEDGETIDLSNETFFVESDDENVAYVDKDGIINARNAGKANITVKLTYNEVEYTRVTPVTVSEIYPLKPAAAKITADSITLKEISGYEYAIQTGDQELVFGNSPVFTGLKPNTDYSFYQRIAATDTHEAGRLSKVLEAATEKDTLKGSVVIKGTVKEGQTLTLDTTGIQNADKLVVKWMRGNQVIDGASGTIYKLTKLDVGYQITAVVSAENLNGTLSAATQEKVAPQEIFAEKVSLNKSELSIKKGKKYTLKTSVAPSNTTNKKLTWKSSNTSVLKVDQNGQITARKSGRATVTVTTVNGRKASCRVTVTQAVDKIKLNRKSKTLGVQETYTLKSTLVPKYAKTSKITWTSSDKKVASVNSKGKITAKKTGTATITVRTGNGKTAECRITVKNKPKSVKLSASVKNLKPGKTLQLKVTRSSGSAGKVTFTSTNEKVATVSSSGKVKALKKGKTTIKAKTYNGKSDTLVIHVK